MLRDFALLECVEIERLRFTALLAFDQRLPYRLDLEVAFVLTTDQFADRLVCVMVSREYIRVVPSGSHRLEGMRRRFPAHVSQAGLRLRSVRSLLPGAGGLSNSSTKLS